MKILKELADIQKQAELDRQKARPEATSDQEQEMLTSDMISPLDGKRIVYTQAEYDRVEAAVTRVVKNFLKLEDTPLNIIFVYDLKKTTLKQKNNEVYGERYGPPHFWLT